MIKTGISKRKTKYAKVKLMQGWKVFWVTFFGPDFTEIRTNVREGDTIRITAKEKDDTNYVCERLSYCNGEKTRREVLENEYGSLKAYEDYCKSKRDERSWHYLNQDLMYRTRDWR